MSTQTMTITTRSSLPYEGATAEQLRHPNVRQFLAIHNMFRRELDKMLQYVDGLLQGDPATSPAERDQRIEPLAQAAYQYTNYLHLHHSIESSQLFPALQPEGLSAAIIERLEAEHWEIAAQLDLFDSNMQTLAKRSPERFQRDLARLAELLRSHLAFEEKHVCPLLPYYVH